MPNIDLSQPINSTTGPSTAQAAAIRTNLGAAPIDAATLTGHVQMTSQGAQTLTDNSAMTRGLSDARYARNLFAYAQSQTTFNNNAGDNVLISLILPIGVYRFESFQKFDTNTNTKAGVILASGAITISGYRTLFDTGTISYGSGAGTISPGTGIITGQSPLGLMSGNASIARFGIITVTSNATIHLAAGQWAASTTNLISLAGAYMIATKLA